MGVPEQAKRDTHSENYGMIERNATEESIVNSDKGGSRK